MYKIGPKTQELIESLKIWISFDWDFASAEMEYCASAVSMLAEEIFQIVEGFVKVPRKFEVSIEEMWMKYSKWLTMWIAKVKSLR